MALTGGATDWPAWSWIPLVIAASVCHAVRNATQWDLSPKIGAVSATLVRFFFGLPFALAWLLLMLWPGGYDLPPLTMPFAGNVIAAAALQVGATAMLLAAMSRRGFTVAVVMSKTEVVQLALFSMLWLGEAPSVLAFAAILLATLGVVMLASPSGLPSLSEVFGPFAAVAGLGVGAGAAFGASNVFFRSAAITMGDVSPLLSGALATVVAQAAQTTFIGGYLLVVRPEVVLRMFRELPSSLLAGATSTLATGLGFGALSMRPATDVRTLGLVEVIFAYAISRRVFRERFGRREMAGIAILLAGVVLLLRS